MDGDALILGSLCIIAGLVEIIISRFIFKKYANEIKSFKENAYKIQAEVVGYDESYDDGEGGGGYSAIYKYNNSELGSIHLTSNMYKSRKPKLGKIKTIYYNPKYPYRYYNTKIDLYFPIILLLSSGLMFVGGGLIAVFSA